MTLLRMLAFRPGGNRGQSAEQPIGQSKPVAKSRPKSQTASKAQHEISASVEPVASSAATDASANKWHEPVWSELLEQLDINGAVKLLASNCAYIRRDSNIVYLCLDGRSESLLTSSRQAALSKALATHFSEPLKVDIAIDAVKAETPLQEEARKIDEGRDAARAGLEADPNVKALKDMFGAQLIPDSVEIRRDRSAPNQE
jgi:DNA polymerase-3 subunit gamma/tau